MSKNQKWAGIFLLGFFAFLFFIPATQAEREVVGKTFYTTANIWYEHEDKIYSTNYHKGSIISVGTKVTIKNMGSGEIEFADEKGQSFAIIFVKKHSSPEMAIGGYFNQYFSEENPLRKDGPFQKLSENERKQIKLGEIKEGMSKKAVLMAYGYPPGHRTPSLASDTWVYWVNRFVNKAVYFKNGRVYKIGH